MFTTRWGVNSKSIKTFFKALGLGQSYEVGNTVGVLINITVNNRKVSFIVYHFASDKTKTGSNPCPGFIDRLKP